MNIFEEFLCVLNKICQKFTLKVILYQMNSFWRVFLHHVGFWKQQVGLGDRVVASLAFFRLLGTIAPCVSSWCLFRCICGLLTARFCKLIKHVRVSWFICGYSVVKLNMCGKLLYYMEYYLFSILSVLNKFYS